MLEECLNLTRKWLKDTNSVSHEELQQAVDDSYYHIRDEDLKIGDDLIAYDYNAIHAAFDGDKAHAQRWVKHFDATRG